MPKFLKSFQALALPVLFFTVILLIVTLLVISNHTAMNDLIHLVEVLEEVGLGRL